MTNIQDEFISTISHELRTPLTSIRGFSQTLLNSWDKISDDDKKKFIGIISEQSSRLINLVENILSVSKMNSEKQILKQVDINCHVLKIISLLKEQYKNHTFVTHLYEKLPISRLDEDKLQQILTNLIENAAKYSNDNTDIIINTKIEAENIIISIFFASSCFHAHQKDRIKFCLKSYHILLFMLTYRGTLQTFLHCVFLDCVVLVLLV